MTALTILGTSIAFAEGPDLLLNGANTRSTIADTVTLTGAIVPQHGPISSVVAVSDQYPSTPFDVLVADAQWSVDVPLVLGVNQITLTAQDTEANRASLMVTVTRHVPPTAFTLTVKSPTSGIVVTEPGITVSGQVDGVPASGTLQVKVAEDDATVIATAGQYTYNSRLITLNPGANQIDVQASAGSYRVAQTVLVTYEPEPDTVPMPELTITAPPREGWIDSDSFQLAGYAVSYIGDVSVSIDGEQVSVPGNGGISHFNSLINIQGGDSKTVTLTVSDSLERMITRQFQFYKDTQAPIFTIDSPLQSTPTENLVRQNPYPLSGTITDPNLASFTINNGNVGLKPVSDGVYAFKVNLGLTAHTADHFSLQAKDSAGNLTTLNVALRLDTAVSIQLALPEHETTLIAGDEPLVFKVVAQITGLAGGEQAQASLVNANDETVDNQPLTLADGIATGSLSAPAGAGDYTVTVNVENSQQLLATTQAVLQVIEPAAVDLAVVGMSPTNNARQIEPNAPITVFFNTALDSTKVIFEVFETAHGNTYINQDEPGTSAMFARGYSLQEINRDHEAVPGEVAWLPGNTGVTFYPKRDFAYNADIYVNVRYRGDNGERELTRSYLRTRPLPTFIEGMVTDEIGNPLAGIEVSLPSLKRSTLTNRAGAFSFGYGDSAEGSLEPGRYRLQFNPGLKALRYGTHARWVQVEAGSRNLQTRVLLPRLNPEIAFSYVRSGQASRLNGGEVALDLTQARILFGNGELEGSLHLQFTPTTMSGFGFQPVYAPTWVYQVQPSGIAVENTGVNGLQVDFALPAYQDQYDYAPIDNELVLLLGLNPDTRQLEPAGVGIAQKRRIRSVGTTHFQVLDAIAYARLPWAEQQIRLQEYLDQKISLDALTVSLHTEVAEQL